MLTVMVDCMLHPGSTLIVIIQDCAQLHHGSQISLCKQMRPLSTSAGVRERQRAIRLCIIRRRAQDLQPFGML